MEIRKLQKTLPKYSKNKIFVIWGKPLEITGLRKKYKNIPTFQENI
jgi:hypothetical protein